MAPEGQPPRPPIQATATRCPTSSGRTKLIFRGPGPPALGVSPEQVWGLRICIFNQHSGDAEAIRAGTPPGEAPV